MSLSDYLKSNRKWLILICVASILMIGLLVLNNSTANEILYVVGVDVTIVAVFVISDWLYLRNKYKELIEVSLNTDEQIDYIHVLNLISKADDYNSINDVYKKIINRLIDDCVGIKNHYVEKTKDINDYYGMWVHQVKTPIAALRLLLGEDESNQTEKLDELFRIEQYVEMNLQYIRMDSDDTDYVFEEVELDSVLRGAIRKYARQFIIKKLRVQYEQTDRTVITDGKSLGFVVEQLLSNAVKYTPSGYVFINVYGQEEKTIIRIEDTGIGIKSDDLPRVCEKGYTGYNGHENNYSSGIGLYLCKKMLIQLGHDMHITSEKGKGTVVEIVI